MTTSLQAGDPVRLGSYELVGRLGVGGQGVVYLGRSETGQVAVKLLHDRLLGDEQARARFVRELAVLRRVAGFCTAQMLEADMEGDQPYIVSEFVPGPSLRQLVRGEGPRTGADLERLAVGSVTALAAIHRAGIVHRDLKPQNVLMGPDGPRVIDFGIARALDAGSTLTSQVVGTPAYMAPEQFTGTGIGPAADLFAWGATLLFAATAHDPFGGGPLPAVMYRILNGTPSLAALPPQLAEIVAASLAKDPSNRPTAEEALLHLLGQRSTSPIPSPAPPLPAPADGPETTRAEPLPTPIVPHLPQPAERAEPSRSAGGGEGSGGEGARVEAKRGLGRAFVVRVGLGVAVGLAGLDVAALGVFVSAPELSAGRVSFLVAAAVFTVLAVVTVLAAAVAWRGDRRAAWVVIAVRLAREALWIVWAVVELQAELDRGHQLQAYLLHVLGTLVVVALVGHGLRVSRRGAPTIP